MPLDYKKLLALQIPAVEHSYGPKDCMLYALGLGLGQDIAFLGGGEAALRRQAKLIEGDELGRLLDAALDLVLGFQPSAF